MFKMQICAPCSCSSASGADGSGGDGEILILRALHAPAGKRQLDKGFESLLTGWEMYLLSYSLPAR